jgi:hypothetical protein
MAVTPEYYAVLKISFYGLILGIVWSYCGRWYPPEVPVCHHFLVRPVLDMLITS